VKVVDNGAGIRKEDTDRIFERFYQTDNPVSNSSYTAGTGIGLALSKSIVELHRGSISVESAPGYGSIFTVRMPKDKSSFSEEELAVETVEPDFGQPGTLPEPLAFAKDEESSNWMEEERPHILIVEDNEELLTILLSLFTPTYRVATAHNGKEGLQKALEECPDIILSDVRMPEMSGIEMCMQLKSNFDVCHIPVVLLTAFASVEQNIEGLQRGADDYIGKPFNTKLLIARCNNMIRNRIVLRKKFTHQRDFDSNLLATNPIDQHFLNEVDGILDRNLDNVKFEMNDLARELGISRSSLFVKFKALAGMTPNDFVLYYRLKRASILLKSNPELQIAEIAYRSGFNSPRYFSHCFKAKFSVTPVEYRKKTDS
jgi:DNA-binding response OmpR family regulator